MFGRRTIALALPLALALSSAQARMPKAAVFDFEMVDTSLQGAARNSSVSRTRCATRARASNLQACGGCDAGFARELGAKYSLTGWIQKVSNLVLNLNIVVRDAETGKVTWSKGVDMRGNTDESSSRVLDYLLRNYLLAPGQGAF